jgi:hypothetical protein
MRETLCLEIQVNSAIVLLWNGMGVESWTGLFVSLEGSEYNEM